ncbi:MULTISPECIES: hypothetical protein [unclassified Nostoc]|uniref:hypothetical protein n=1 Tax=unclassified Nostoc TaxID=2593658 RepID=UPI002610DA97|nr:hypothetical protein [Nostoc sp. S13]MDF5738006.1 hypothetical protein [Nostoc sp. S13]
MKTSKLFKAFSLASTVAISAFSICLTNQKSLADVNVTPPGWCVHAGARIVFGKFDADEGIDALCYDKAGSKWINYSDGEHFYAKTNWCTHEGSYIMAVKQNYDVNYDLICIDRNRGFWVINANPNGTFNF